MSLLGEPFLHDVFVSYPHADADRKGASEIKEWSQQFADKIRSKLLMFQGFRDISFYLDESERRGERLSETAEITEALKEAVGKSALLLAMMSPWYLESDWCRKERDWWQKGTDAQTLVLGRAFDRAFIVQVMDTDAESWPALFKDKDGISKKGFIVFDRAKPKFKRFPFRSIGTPEDVSAYNTVLVDIVGEMGSMLDEMRECLKHERMKQNDNKLLEETGQALYLHSRPEVPDQFEKASEDLRTAGYAVGPEQPSPLRSDGRLDDEQREYLASSDAVMILGIDDKRVGQDIIVVGRNNRRLAQAFSRKILPCAVFDVIGTEKHPASRIDNARNLKINWIDATEANWREETRSWLQGSVGLAG